VFFYNVNILLPTNALLLNILYIK